ncbi:MAG TPA: hypothetical protein ENG33_10030 [Chloroflexi bacterium]|nr:hypothetical protein [Chloroflexota bacterium]
MIDDKDLKALMDYGESENPVVSLYLDVDLTKRTKEEVMLVLRGLLKEASAQADKADIERIRDFFTLEYDWQAKGVAVFSCEKSGLWQTYSLAAPVQDGVYVMPKPYVRSLVILKALHDRYGIALVSREQARFFLLLMGEVMEYEGVVGSIPGRHKQGGWAQARYQRHIDERAAQQLRSAAEAFVNLYSKEKWNYIILGGTDENTNMFQEFLPSNLRELVIGSFAADMTASTREIRDEALALAQAFEKKRAASLVKEAVTKAAKGKGAAIGLDDTLNAVREGRVQVLLVMPGFKASGRACENCGYVTVQEIENCPFCSANMVEVPDVVERAVEQTFKANGKVVVVQDGEELKKAGSIAALLRY